MNVNTGMPTLYSDAMYNDQILNNQLVTLQNQAATGKNFANVSDDPVAAMTVIADTDQNQFLTTHLSNIQAATSSLNTSSAALTQVSNIFSQAKSIAIEASSSTNDTTSFTAMAQQVSSLIGQLMNAANTQNNGTYVFAGTASNTQPYTVTSTDGAGNPTAISYQGSAGTSSVTVDAGQSAAVDYAGSSIFGGAFQSLINLRDDLNNVNNLSSADQIQAISNDITSLDNVSTQIETVQGAQSATLQSLSSLQTNLQNMQLTNQENITNIGDVNTTNIVVQLQAFENQMQLSLEAFSKISSTSLLNYLQ